MTDGPTGILVGVDGSPDSEAAIRWATHEALMREQPIRLLHAIAPVVVTWPVAYLEASYLDSMEANGRDVLDQAQKIVQAAAGDNAPPAIETQVVHAAAPPALVAASRKAYMTVSGSRGLGAIGRALLGSVSSGLLHHGQGPVAILGAGNARPGDDTSPVLLGVDGSPASEEATALAFDEASRRGVGLVALHAWSDVGFGSIGSDWDRYEGEGHRILAERLAGWQERYPDVQVQRRIVSDEPARRLVEPSEQAQLVVVGSRGRGGFTSLVLGSVAAKVAQAAAGPVVVVRPR
ncbi:universal stress protein [Mycolicibacterium celeriflavum]|uniref:Universal stress protein n=1 Tax=Mycolicibacterium celeriflavum TaxID=1249101 RepID=A0A1X0BW65_MYCCF|nr:universal stress protein [Mycolicibacterium celeriflavum]MCV7240657.1 universal stress protein [Mycolicibacterium celeriflavum]ORA48134.1 universal stress protein [Mycolicibacterium celeriflavum]BBY43504.1 universal stress protein [Mycolicibacterium celeriflavum]